ncbi:MAG: glutamate--tRNA ligase [Bacteroidales bacterium]|nr:glutamate--tRNA ligase [Bacteroidales bacterium]MBQ3206658.1 glutamate--tRNA ligase [Bacteroidales bacterium]
MERKTRVRFAPSPTGPLHMGGVRTALYNYLFAKQHGGDFIIRIEDTDSQRFVPGAEKYIIEALNWCGIIPDEGVDADGNVVETASERHPHAPYRQSQRKPIYRQYAEQLVEGGFAYYAFDTAEELGAKRAEMEASGQTFIYGQTTRMGLRNSLSMPEEEWRPLLESRTDWTIRFKMPENRVVKMDDLIRGHVEVNTSTLDDKVLWKRADELPTYHLANIVDDHLMEITEVIRGEEWLPSLPLHYLLYEAFGWTETQPRFAHLSLLLKPDGKGKLSKRDGDRLGFPVFPLKWVNAEGEVSRGYREDGYFPEAFVNLLAMLGWNPGTEQELFSLEELIGAFSLERVIKSGARFNADKAKWYNKEYLRTKSVEELTALYIPVLESHGLQIVDCPACALTAGSEMTVSGADFENRIFSRQYVERIVALIQERATFVADFWDIAPYLFVAPAEFVEKDAAKFWKEENYTLALQVADFILNFEGEFTKEALEGPLEEYIRGNEWPMGKVMNCLRLAMVGGSNGLGIADIVTLIGKKEFAKRIDFIKATLGC